MGLYHGALAFLLVTACGGGAESPPRTFIDAGPELMNPEQARLWPPLVHAGHDGSRGFQVPVYTDLSHHVFGDPTWTSGDESVLTVEAVDPPPQYPRRGVWAMITPRAPGQTTVSATIGVYTVSSPVIVAAYSPAQVAAGQERYTTSGAGDRAACASCHQEPGGADHSPTEMAFHDDEAILLVITAGRYPDLCITDDGDPCTCDSAGCTREPGYMLELTHEWNLTEDEADGIVPYLRSLPPRGF
jgi:mono/diheme cytochrome c family protein